MARIAFVNPAYGTGYYSRASRSPAVAKSGTVYYPYWLCYAAGWAEDHSHKVDIVDAAAKRLPHIVVVEELYVNRPDLIVLDTTRRASQATSSSRG
jgi:anaerobic magnesium-protoporphyrin IX monomethyl ester cyclase